VPTAPVFIPYVNRPDLLRRAVESVPRKLSYSPIIINNSGQRLPVEVDRYDHMEPPVPLTFSQTQNWMLKIASQRAVPFYFFLHSDAIPGDDTLDLLFQKALALEASQRWGAIFTAYDSLAAFNTEAMTAVGGWDTLFTWYASDCDMYRRLRLAGYPTVESNLPVFHQASQTLNSDPEVKRRVDVEFPLREQIYLKKWGGKPGFETFETPWNKG